MEIYMCEYCGAEARAGCSCRQMLSLAASLVPRLRFFFLHKIFSLILALRSQTSMLLMIHRSVNTG